MVLSDFLSMQKTDDSNPHEIIPISFSLRNVLLENYYKLDNLTETKEIEADKYMVQTRSQTKSSGIKMPEVHSLDKVLILHVKAEHQKSVVTLPTHQTKPICQTQPIDKGLPTNIPSIPKPRIGQVRATPRAVQSLPEHVVQS